MGKGSGHILRLLIIVPCFTLDLLCLTLLPEYSLLHVPTVHSALNILATSTVSTTPLSALHFFYTRLSQKNGQTSGSTPGPQ